MKVLTVFDEFRKDCIRNEKSLCSFSQVVIFPNFFEGKQDNKCFFDITKITNNATTTTIVCFDDSYICFFITTIYLLIILLTMSCFYDNFV
jgi:hypothetical protein